MANLDEALVQDQLRQLLAELERHQIRSGSDAGAIMNPAWGVPQPYRAAWLAAGTALLSEQEPGLLTVTVAALTHLREALLRHPLLDLLECNYDSAPDTAFAVQLLAVAIDAGGERPELADLVQLCRECVEIALPAMAVGGFHTPNHRWVLASALAMGARSLGQARPGAIDELLAEGLDIDDEGAWIERSAGVYDAVCDRAVLALADAGAIAEAEAMDAVMRNLRLNRLLLQPDGTIETGLSSRQDRGRSVVPYELAPVMVEIAARTGEADWSRLAACVWAAGDPTLPAAIWMLTALRAHPGVDLSPQPPPSESRLLPRSGVWRHRRGQLAVTLGTRRSDLATMRVGTAAASVRMQHLYFSPEAGAFWAEEITEAGDSVELVSSGTRDPRRPGYELPLGKPVAADEWEEALTRRRLRPLEPMRTRIRAEATSEGLELGIRTESGHSGVLVVIACDFPEGGTWITEDTAFEPRAGQTIFLRRGHGEMRFRSHGIRLGPGADRHSVWEPRNLPPAPDQVRVLIPLGTPIDHLLELARTL